MSCNYRWFGQTVVVSFSGFVSAADFVQSAEVVASDPRFDRLRVIYNDFLHVDGHAVDPSAYARVAARRLGAARTNPNLRVVFIATGELAHRLAMAVADTVLGKSFDPVVVGSMEDAEHWFGRQPVLDADRPYLMQ